jgi:hypothetical protein
MVGGARGAAGSRLGTYIFSIAMAEEDCKARILVLDVQDRDCRPLHASVRVHRLSQSRSHGRGGNDLKGDRTAFAAPRARMPRIAPCRLPHQRGNITFAPTRASVHARMNLRGGRPTCFVVTKAVTSAPGVSTAVVSQSRTPGNEPNHGALGAGSAERDGQRGTKDRRAGGKDLACCTLAGRGGRRRASRRGGSPCVALGRGWAVYSQLQPRQRDDADVARTRRAVFTSFLLSRRTWVSPAARSGTLQPTRR